MQPTASMSRSDNAVANASVTQVFDIEHVPVHDDPRAWSSLRKNIGLGLVSAAAMTAGLGGSIQNPAVKQMELDLPATSSQFSWSISAYILVQGLIPLAWSAISEVKGRKLVYLISLALFTVGSIAAAVSRSIGLVIAFRCLQAAGSSAGITIGATTLADMFDPAERGAKMGIYYMAPLLGPSIGPLLGGILTTGLGWRAIFWCLAIVSSAVCVCFLLFFHDTFRQERSLIYQSILQHRLLEPDSHNHAKGNLDKPCKNVDPEKNASPAGTGIAITLSLRDVNPYKPLALVLRRWNNLAILFASGLLFAFSFLITYASARTLSSKYNYNPLTIGLVLLAFGLGNVFGSLLGGRWSDHELAKLKAANGNVSYPEMRLKSAIPSVFLLPPCVLAFGWICEKHVHVAAICVTLFCCGFFVIWTYSSALAYIADSNTGRSSSAFATNSAFRGTFAFVATEVAVPLQDGVGDGWTYTIWAFIVLISGLLILLVSWRGQRWRMSAEEREASSAGKPASQL